jgi:hypothetical protein
MLPERAVLLLLALVQAPLQVSLLFLALFPQAVALLALKQEPLAIVQSLPQRFAEALAVLVQGKS